MSKTTQTSFLHYSNCYLADIPRLEYQLLKNGKKILLVIAKIKEEKQNEL